MALSADPGGADDVGCYANEGMEEVWDNYLYIL